MEKGADFRTVRAFNAEAGKVWLQTYTSVGTRASLARLAVAAQPATIPSRWAAGEPRT